MFGFAEHTKTTSLWPFSSKGTASAGLGRETFGEVLDGCGCFFGAADQRKETDIGIEGDL